MLKTIAIADLKIGMYVKDVLSAKGAFKVKTEGVIKSDSIIAQLKKQGATQVVVEYEPEEIKTDDANDTEPTDENSEEVTAPQKSATRTEKQSIAGEFNRSCEIYDNSNKIMRSVFDDVLAGKKLNPETMAALANDITDSVIRNEYAMAILTRIRDKSTYQWEHAINSAVLMCGFALFLGFKKETIQQLTLGALLHDVGVAKVPPVLINKEGKLSTNEQQVVRKHVAWGYDICKSDGFTHKYIIDMAVNHHERLDGSGYPRGITGEKLSKLARMIAIIDVYDAMTGERKYKKGDQPINALRFLLGKKDQFDHQLVQQFIKFIGVHPVGSLIKLSNDKLAVVLEGNRDEPLKPKVKVFYNLKHKHYLTSSDCDLSKTEESILASVRPEDYEINLSKVIRELLF